MCLVLPVHVVIALFKCGFALKMTGQLVPLDGLIVFWKSMVLFVVGLLEL